MKKILDKGLNLLRNDKLVDTFKLAETWVEKIGLACLYFVLPFLGIVFCVAHATQIDTIVGSAFGVAIGFVIACILLGYIADKMLEYVRPSIDQAKTTIVNAAFFDILALVCAIVSLVTGIATLGSLFTGELTQAFSFFVAFALFLYFAVMLLSSDKMLNVRVQSSATPAQSLIAITALLIKAMYRIVPLAFGALVVLSVLMCIDAIFANGLPFDTVVEFTETLSTAAVLPLAGYFIFLFYYFVIDWFCAFFRIADTVEKISETKTKAK